MKKIIIGSLAVAISIAAQAASFNWKAQSGWVSPDDENAWDGNKVYVFDAYSYAASQFLSDWGSSGASALANSIGSNTVINEGFLVQGTSELTLSGGKASLYAVLLDSTEKNAYVADGAAAVTITDAHNSGASVTFDFGDVVTGNPGSAGWTAAAPEPTSGLLILLGMAGLALKRKRA